MSRSYSHVDSLTVGIGKLSDGKSKGGVGEDGFTVTNLRTRRSGRSLRSFADFLWDFGCFAERTETDGNGDEWKSHVEYGKYVSVAEEEEKKR